MANDNAHPSQKFIAPFSIRRGTPLKELMDRRLVALIGESLAAVVDGFDSAGFVASASSGLDGLELKQRALKIADAMAEQLPASFVEAAPLLVKAFGPPLEQTDGNGLAPFFYFPHSQLITSCGVSHFESGMMANLELTKRFTAEFSIRPFLIQYRSPCLEMLNYWTTDKNAHVRRLV
ncbi:MAG: DNA alkylation repair protein, partial [Planctomycetaceae bacterium]